MIPRVSTMMNRDIERHYFEQFRQTFELPDGAVEYGDKPDVLLKGVRTIGIEITRFYLQPGHFPESEQRQRQHREGIVSGAQNVYRAAGGRGIELTIGFNAINPITVPRMKILPKELADLARSIDSQKSGSVDPSVPSLFETPWTPINEVAFTSLFTPPANTIKQAEAQTARLCTPLQDPLLAQS
jgi:hypothetical protein